MTNLASTIKIENFKSIKTLELNNCKRINLFIGRPNVGKSNILEALSLFSLPHLKTAVLADIIRVEQVSELFFDGNTQKGISVMIDSDIINISDSDIRVNIQDCFKGFYTGTDITQPLNRFENETVFNLQSRKANPYKSYLFPNKIKFEKEAVSFLLPPYGVNLFDIIQSNMSLKQELLDLFRVYGLHLVFDKSSQELKIMKGLEKGDIFLIPFNSIADSLQRLIFFKTAIASNKDSIITFEEPEAHTYPPYIAQIAQDIIQSASNQFFITTHSPYVVNEMLEKAQDELAVFLVDFKNGHTIVKRLSEDELDEVYANGVDLFFNNELFL